MPSEPFNVRVQAAYSTLLALGFKDFQLVVIDRDPNVGGSYVGYSGDIAAIQDLLAGNPPPT